MSGALWPVILAMGAVTYALRAGGFLVHDARLSPFLRRLLRNVPVAVFATLVATSVPGQDAPDTAARVAMLALAALLLARGARLLWVLLVGLGGYLALRPALH